MPASNILQSRQSALIKEVDVVIEAYAETLDFMRSALQAHQTADSERFSAEREKAYQCLSVLLDGVTIEPMDLADSFRQVHLHALRLIWSKEPQQWQTAIKLIERLHNSCQDSRTKATTVPQGSTKSL